MTLVSIPKPLRDKLGDEATDSLVELFQKQSEEQKTQLFDLLEERFARRLQESEARLEKRMDLGFLEVQKQFGEIQKQFGEVQKQFGEVYKQIGEVHKAVAVQTRWILAALLGGAVLYPVVLRIMEKMLP